MFRRKSLNDNDLNEVADQPAVFVKIMVCCILVGLENLVQVTVI